MQFIRESLSAISGKLLRLKRRLKKKLNEGKK